jgi:SEL1 protein
MYSRGIGVELDLEKAFMYYQEAALEGNGAAQNGLATMYLHGRGVPMNKQKAMMLFRLAAKQGNADAFYNLGVLSLKGGIMIHELQPRADHYHDEHEEETETASADSVVTVPDYETAYGYFYVAAQQGHTLSMHKAARLSMSGIGTIRSCSQALDFMKQVAERGVWDQELRQAYRAYTRGDYSLALRKYIVLAEQGYEIAQHNAAWMLEQQLGTSSAVVSSPDLRKTAKDAANSPIELSLKKAKNNLGELTLRLYKNAASQGNIDANLKIGDFYFYGPDAIAGIDVNYERAMAHYALAASRNAQASFNLGFMYQYGIGSTQDFFLAKRYYDLSRA